jgi:hypothetical protein
LQLRVPCGFQGIMARPGARANALRMSGFGGLLNAVILGNGLIFEHSHGLPKALVAL